MQENIQGKIEEVERKLGKEIERVKRLWEKGYRFKELISNLNSKFNKAKTRLISLRNELKDDCAEKSSIALKITVYNNCVNMQAKSLRDFMGLTGDFIYPDQVYQEVIEKLSRTLKAYNNYLEREFITFAPFKMCRNIVDLLDILLLTNKLEFEQKKGAIEMKRYFSRLSNLSSEEFLYQEKPLSFLKELSSSCGSSSFFKSHKETFAREKTLLLQAYKSLVKKTFVVGEITDNNEEKQRYQIMHIGVTDAEFRTLESSFDEHWQAALNLAMDIAEKRQSNYVTTIFSAAIIMLQLSPDFLTTALSVALVSQLSKCPSLCFTKQNPIDCAILPKKFLKEGSSCLSMQEISNILSDPSKFGLYKHHQGFGKNSQTMVHSMSNSFFEIVSYFLFFKGFNSGNINIKNAISWGVLLYGNMRMNKALGDKFEVSCQNVKSILGKQA